jgi:aspartyl-tRNA(Asn)/glutamyl-tRNA(Gln) amidotransferase subunit A
MHSLSFPVASLIKSFSAFDNYFLQAQRVRTLVRRDFDRVFRAPNVLSAPSETSTSGVDILIHPSAIRTAPRLDEDRNESKSILDSYLQDVLTVPASLAGLPALSVPMGLGEDGWPVGVSLVGQWGHEKTILNLGKVLGVSKSSA